jgi:hypothetical protein
MRKLFSTCLLVLLLDYAWAQPDTVQWQCSTKMNDAGTWEVHLTTTLQEGLYICAQQQPVDAVTTLIKFPFVKNPLVGANGPVKELGQIDKFKNPTLDIEQLQYEKKVDFIQKVKLKSNVKKHSCLASPFMFLRTKSICRPQLLISEYPRKDKNCI